MAMRLHELHPSVIHLPLVLLPAAATVDLMAATSARPLRARILDRAGRRLWWAGAAAGLFAGLAGMAASQEIQVPEGKPKDMMFLHGIGNFALVLAAFGVSSWRSARRATLASSLLGVGASAAAIYTAYLGGELVYAHGAGVKAMPETEDQRVASPPILSAAAPRRFVGDALAGLWWLLSRAGRTLTGREPVAAEAASFAASVPSRAGEEPFAPQPELRH